MTRRTGIATALLSLSLLTTTAASAQSPTVSPMAPPGTSPSPTASAVPEGQLPTGLAWRGVIPPLARPGNAITALTTWHDGFAGLETTRQGRAAAVWTSPQGTEWVRSLLPPWLTSASDLLPFHAGLALIGRMRGTLLGTAFDVSVSIDAATWQHAGHFETLLPARLAGLQVNDVHVVSLGDRLVVLAAVNRDLCCGLVAGGLAERSSGLGSRPGIRGGSFAWVSRDGARWLRHRVSVVGGLGDPGVLHFPTSTATGLLAIGEGGITRLLRSSDGVHWSPVGAIADALDLYGGAWLADSPDASIIVGGIHGAVPPPSDGVRYLDTAGRHITSVAASGTVVLAAGSLGVDSDEPAPPPLQTRTMQVPSVLVSVDGGMSWDWSTSSTGSVQGCLGPVVIRGTTALMATGCGSRLPAMFAADLSPTSSPASPSLTPSTPPTPPPGG